MEFLVKKQDGDIKLSAGDLFDILTSKIDIKNPKTEFELLNQSLYESLEKSNLVTPLINKSLILNILYLSLSLGYYYRIFLEKNKVEIVNKEEGENETSTGIT